MKAPKILIIDDDRELFVLLSEYLTEEGFSCVYAPEPEGGLQAVAGQDIDAVVLDVMLPGMNGFEVLRRLRAEPASSAVPVLMLTARGEEIDRVVGLELGADDYLGKPFSPRELSARLRAILRRSAAYGANALSVQNYQLGDVLINRAAHSITVNNQQISLTASELRLLTQLSQNIGQVVGRDVLYQCIFGHQAYPMDRSLDMLVSRLRKKLGPRPDGAERIKAVRGEGYMYLLGGDQA